MRKIIVLAAAAILASATVAGAQQQPTPQPKPAAPSAQPAAPAIQSVNIVDFSELPQATQTQVNQVIAKRGDAALQKLRSSIDATPQQRWPTLSVGSARSPRMRDSTQSFVIC